MSLARHRLTGLRHSIHNVRQKDQPSEPVTVCLNATQNTWVLDHTGPDDDSVNSNWSDIAMRVGLREDGDMGNLTDHNEYRIFYLWDLNDELESLGKPPLTSSSVITNATIKLTVSTHFINQVSTTNPPQWDWPEFSLKLVQARRNLTYEGMKYLDWADWTGPGNNAWTENGCYNESSDRYPDASGYISDTWYWPGSEVEGLPQDTQLNFGNLETSVSNAVENHSGKLSMLLLSPEADGHPNTNDTVRLISFFSITPGSPEIEARKPKLCLTYIP